MARAPRAATDALYLGVLLDAAELNDPALPSLLRGASASAVVPPELADRYPASVRALAEQDIAVLAAFPRLPRYPRAALHAEENARADVARASGKALPPVVALHGLGTWALVTSYAEHLRLGVATPLTGPLPELRGRQQVVVAVDRSRLRGMLTSLAARARTQHLPVHPLGALWQE